MEEKEAVLPFMMNTKIIKQNLIQLSKRQIISGVTELYKHPFWNYLDFLNIVKEEEDSEKESSIL
jgi:hypothetical protein